MKPGKTQKKKKVGSYPFYTVVFSIALSLSFIGLVGAVSIHAYKFARFTQENIEVHVYLNNYITKAELMKVKKVLSSKPFVLRHEDNSAQVSYISKEEALSTYIKETGDDFRDMIEGNPLKSSFIFKINPKFLNAAKLISMLAIMLLLNNTIKLAPFSQRFLIRSMQLVGATSSFIQTPFLTRALLHGLLGGLIASLSTFIVIEYAYEKIDGLQDLYDWTSVGFLLVALPIIGCTIGWLSSYLSVNKYLKLSLDDLY